MTIAVAAVVADRSKQSSVSTTVIVTTPHELGGAGVDKERLIDGPKTDCSASHLT